MATVVGIAGMLRYFCLLIPPAHPALVLHAPPALITRIPVGEVPLGRAIGTKRRDRGVNIIPTKYMTPTTDLSRLFFVRPPLRQRSKGFVFFQRR